MMKGLFNNEKAIIGVIDFTSKNPIQRTMEELLIYERTGVDGIVFNNSYDNELFFINNICKKINYCEYNLTFGVNIVNNFSEGFNLINKYEFLEFIQIDTISGNYVKGTIDYDSYENLKLSSEVPVLGGIPINSSNLTEDLVTAKNRCEAIVVTEETAGIQIPIEKIKLFRNELGDFPLIIGAGVNENNFVTQMQYADACIIGTEFKEYNAYDNVVSFEKVKKLVDLRNENF